MSPLSPLSPLSQLSPEGPSTFDPTSAVRAANQTPLARRLAERIGRDGPVSFRDWMDACLYQPGLGYYRRGQPTVGRNGDFLTSPEVHPLFGAALGHLAGELWHSLGRPGPMRVAEVGPGTGALAESMLSQIGASEPELLDVIEYTLVEPDDQAADSQRRRLAHFPNVTRVPAISQLSAEHRLVFANELLDAVPVHLLRFEDGRWRERYVDYSSGSGFRLCSRALDNERLLETLRDTSPTDGLVAEVAPERGEIVHALSQAVAERGLLLLFDYGYRRDRLYAPWRMDGTLMTFRKHVPGDDPLAHPGEQDITCHIDIDQVIESAQAAGLNPMPALTQSEWLHQLGAAVLPAVADADGDTAAYLAVRRAAETLTDPAGLGRIAVLGFTRGDFPPLPGWMSR
ncbi:MAG: SAM-dependent methyltransferase [Chloroflexi bacterium]|nr:SAM-dependent methyltransferase [Chloroflexota bacterium]